MRPLIFLFSLLTLISCSHTIDCRRHHLTFSVSDYGRDSSKQMIVRVIRYQNESNFTLPLDSTDNILNSEEFYYPFDGDKEYVVILLPQNRRHTLRRLHYGEDKRKGSPGLDSEQCYDSATYEKDGIAISVPMTLEGEGWGSGKYAYL